MPLVFDSTFVIDTEGAAFGRPLADGVYDVFVLFGFRHGAARQDFERAER